MTNCSTLKVTLLTPLETDPENRRILERWLWKYFVLVEQIKVIDEDPTEGGKINRIEEVELRAELRRIREQLRVWVGMDLEE